MGFISAAAYTLWGILLKYNPVGRVAVFGFMNPIFSFLLSALLLGEGSQAFGWTGLSALALVCAGILIVNLAEGRKPAEGKEADGGKEAGGGRKKRAGLSFLRNRLRETAQTAVSTAGSHP